MNRLRVENEYGILGVQIVRCHEVLGSLESAWAEDEWLAKETVMHVRDELNGMLVRAHTARDHADTEELRAGLTRRIEEIGTLRESVELLLS